MERIEKVVKGLCEAIGIIHGHVGKRYWGYGEQACRDAIELLKEQNGLMLALEQSNASNEYLNNSVSELGETINILKDEIKRLKEQQPKKGEWLKDYTYRKDHPRNYCSVCNMTGGFRTDYCPNCGAYMRKDGEQE